MTALDFGYCATHSDGSEDDFCVRIDLENPRARVWFSWGALWRYWHEGREPRWVETPITTADASHDPDRAAPLAHRYAVSQLKYG